MAKLTRRGLIKGVSIGAGAAGVLAAAVVAGDRIGVTSATGPTGQVANKSNDPLVVCVNDPSSGDLVFMQGARQVTVHNPAIVQDLLAL
jgi:hypothetical protein